MTGKLASGILVLTAMLVGTAIAAEKFEDNASIEIKGMPDRGGIVYVLEKTGEDKTQSGVYRLRHKSSGNYLNVTKADAGALVGFTTDKKKGSEWILLKNSTGWSIIAKANGANTVTRSTKSSSGLELQRNEGSKDQLWQINPVK